MRERAWAFGPGNGIIGVSTEPSPEHGRDDAPWLVFANVGLNHRVGPYRLWVDLARELAQHGYPSLRFDTSGLGDSEPRKEAVSDLQRAVLDFRDALAHLSAKRGASRFVLMGLCSGVDSVHTMAVEDARVVGAAFMDGYTYRTPGFYLRHVTVRNLLPARWRRFVRRRWLLRFDRRVARRREAGEVDEIFVREYPTEQRFRADVDAMVGRGTKLLYVYSGEIDGQYNYRDQLFDMLGGKHRRAIEVEYYRRADHVYSFIEDRRVLLTRLSEWVRANFDSRSPATP